MARSKSPDPWILHAALDGLEVQKQRLDEHIAEVRRLLGATVRKPAAASEEAKKPRRRLSAAARKRMAAAQRRRWAEFRKKAEQPQANAQKKVGRKTVAAKQTAETGSPRRKRRISAAGRKRMAEAAQRRWAEFRRKAEKPAQIRKPAAAKKAAKAPQ